MKTLERDHREDREAEMNNRAFKEKVKKDHLKKLEQNKE